MKSLPPALLALFASATAVLAQLATAPPLQKTSASPIAIGQGANHAVAGFDFNLDGQQDLLTLGAAANGHAEVRVTFGNGAGGFSGGAVADLGLVSYNVDDDALAAGAIFPPEALGGTPQPSVAVIVGGALRLLSTQPSLGSSVLLQDETAPSFPGTTLRSVVVGDLNGDGRDDIVVSGRVQADTQPGTVYVVLNSAGGLQAPQQLAQTGSEAGKLALGDVNNDGLVDIVVCDSAEFCAKIYFANAAGVFSAAPVTLDAVTPLADARPRAVAIGQILPGGASEIVLYLSSEDPDDTNKRFLQFAVYKHTGGTSFTREPSVGFSAHANSFIHYLDLSLGDLNGDGQLDIVGTNPVDDVLQVWPLALFNGSIDLAFSPLQRYDLTNTPDFLTIGNFNGDTYPSGSLPKLDVAVTHVGASGDRTIDIFLNGTASLPPGTPSINNAQWPVFGGELTASGAPASTLKFAVVGSDGRLSTTLPTGQKFTAAGQITGIATNGSYSLKIRVTSGRKFSEKTFAFTVDNVASLTPGAIAWWPGEDAGADVVGGHTAFSPFGAPAYGEGKVGRAFSFDGVDDFLGANDTSALDVRGNLTIEAWVRPVAGSTGVRTIVAKHDSADLDLSFALQVDTRGRLECITRRATDRKTTTVTAAKSLVLGAWSHVAAVRRGAQTELYLNGELVKQGLAAVDFLPPSTAGQAVTIGATCTAPTGARAAFWKGEIDELTLYRRPLDPEEIDLIFKVGSAGKDRYDASREFSTVAPPQPTGATWRYGSMPFGTYNPANFVPFPTLDTSSPALDVWKTASANGPEVRRNRLTTTHSTGAGASEIRYAPAQVAQRTGTDGSYSIVRWTAPEAGRYAVGATWQCINAAGTSTGLRIYHNANSITSGTGPNQFVGSQSFTGTVNVAAGDTIDFWLQQNFVADDTTGLFASVVPLPEDFVPVVTPEIADIDNDAPLQTGKLWEFRVRQTDSDDHQGRISVKLQYSATPNDPGSWLDVPGGALTRSSSASWRLESTTLPVGAFAFRAVTTVTGEGTFFSDATQIFNIGAATTQLEFVSREQSVASDPTGATTHRGDLITYTFKVRNAGGRPGDNVFLRVLIPEGTSAYNKKGFTTAKGRLFKKAGLSGFPDILYWEWNLRDLASVPLDDAAEYQLTVQVSEPSRKNPSVNPVGTTITQNDTRLVEVISRTQTGQLVVASFLPAVTVANQIEVTSSIVSGAPVAAGGLVKLEFTARNRGSTSLKDGAFSIVGENGLVIQDTNSSLVFLDAGAESGIPPLDALTGKRVVARGVPSNPFLGELPDRSQSAYFVFGGLPPGGQQKVRVTFRVPYDWTADLPLVLDSANAFANTPTATFIGATASPLNISFDPTPASGKPRLIVTANQITANALPDQPGIGAVTTAALGVPDVTPKRTSNQITYRLLIGNLGNIPARFMKAITALPAGTEYRKGSAKIFTGNAATDRALPDPELQDDQLFFTLPDLDRDGGTDPDINPALFIEFTVTVNRDLPLRDNLGNPTRITFPGAFVTSREVREPGFQFEERIAQLVEPGRMQYSYSRSPAEFTPQTPFIYHSIFFWNSGGINRSGVAVKYEVPAGLKFHNAILTDRVNQHTPGGRFQSRPIAKPAVGATSGEVAFDIGTVKPGEFGFAQVILTPDAGNVPTSGADRFNATATWTGSDSTTDFSPGLREGRRLAPRAETGDAPTVGTIPQPYSDPTVARTFLLVTAPSSVSATPPAEFTYQVAWGNVSDVDATSVVTFPIPIGTQFVSATTVESTHPAPAQGDFTPGNADYPEGYVNWSIALPARAACFATVTVRLRPGTTGTINTDRVFLGTFTSANRYAIPVATRIVPAGEALDPAAVFATGLGAGASAYLGSDGSVGAGARQELAKFGANSTSISLVGADNARVKENGAVIIPIGGGRMVAAGGGNILSNANGGLVTDNGAGFAIRIGLDTQLKVDFPGLGPTAVSSLISDSGNLYRAGKLGLTSNGGRNLLRLASLVGNDGASLIGLDGATLVGNDGASLGTFGIGANGVSFTPVSSAALPPVRMAGLVSTGLKGLIGDPAALVNAGGMNLIGLDGGSLIGNDGGTLVGNDGASLIGDNSAGVIARDGASVIARDGASVIARDGASLIGNDGGTLISPAGGNILSSGSGVVPTNGGR